MQPQAAADLGLDLRGARQQPQPRLDGGVVGGGGAALMAAAMDLAQGWGADQVWLGVWEHNAKALAFYARWGFREVGEHHFTIGDQVDRDLILAKDLA